ncbi:MAG TPA: hypothetical protein VFI09_00300 [Solirubrobacterales bacterium]|nr:hypothetical protein [Solirubrobacterales bacterium]
MQIADARINRLMALAALGIAVLYIASVPIGTLTGLPGGDASGATIARFIGEHRGGILAAVVLNGIAWCTLMPCVFVGLRALLGGTAATVAMICAAVEAAIVGVALTFGAVLAYGAPDLGPQLAKVLMDGFDLGTNASAWPTVPCLLALVVAARRSGAFSRPTLAFAGLVALLHAITAVSFARSGALSPSGIAVAGPGAFAILMILVGAALLRRPLAGEATDGPADVALTASAART